MINKSLFCLNRNKMSTSYWGPWEYRSIGFCYNCLPKVLQELEKTTQILVKYDRCSIWNLSHGNCNQVYIKTLYCKTKYSNPGGIYHEAHQIKFSNDSRRKILKEKY